MKIDWAHYGAPRKKVSDEVVQAFLHQYSFLMTVHRRPAPSGEDVAFLFQSAGDRPAFTLLHEVLYETTWNDDTEETDVDLTAEWYYSESGLVEDHVVLVESNDNLVMVADDDDDDDDSDNNN